MRSDGPEPSVPSVPVVALERLRVIVLSGAALGLLVGGVGSRLAMLVLRLTSPDGVVGLTSDDGFEIGQVTLSGTYNLCLVGVGFGLLGAAVYGLVAPWLIGPRWFRDVTVALGTGVVVGSMLVHTDGVDFTVLEPAALAIASFVAVPALFGGFIGPVRRWAERPDAWVSSGWRRWALPIALIACFPPTAFLVAVIGAVVLVWTALRAGELSAEVQRHVVARPVIQAAWLTIALLGLASLAGDAQALL